jgi:hypothetical protein
MSKENAKIKVKSKIFPKGDDVFVYLSAQDWDRFTPEEKDVVIECFADKGKNGFEYLEKMKSMFPPVWKPKPLTWRAR